MIILLVIVGALRVAVVVEQGLLAVNLGDLGAVLGLGLGHLLAERPCHDDFGLTHWNFRAVGSVLVESGVLDVQTRRDVDVFTCLGRIAQRHEQGLAEPDLGRAGGHAVVKLVEFVGGFQICGLLGYFGHDATPSSVAVVVLSDIWAR
ncbi:Uncharacterised protein [Mycobacteroides abscessus subsp. massiliense]|nr:Uncharacterised protein [Mycobacteroides abscessus subsp. massiliense]